jgi:uncharacterized protein
MRESIDGGFGPLAGRGRIASMDVLRGLALLGIGLMNVEYFSEPLMGRVDGIAPGLSGLDRAADAFVYLFVSSKFWTMFSLLFGMGFAVMLERARTAGRDVTPIYLRRTFGLLLIGVIHACLIWAGDILVTYALSAFVLLLCFGRAPVSGLWAWGGGLYLVPLGLFAMAALFVGLLGDAALPLDAGDSAAREAFRQAEAAAYANGSYVEATAMRVRFLGEMLAPNLVMLPMVLGMFLIGAWLVRCGAMADPAAHRRLFDRFAWLGGLLGLGLTLVGTALDPSPVVEGEGMTARALWAAFLQMLGAPLMALAYVGVVVLALQRGVRWLHVLAPAGRMALTLYLMQSVIGTLVFYGYGLGMWGQVGRAWQVSGVLVVFVLQVALSHWWMARFRFGPLEWAWRSFTYLDVPPMRRHAHRSP